MENQNLINIFLGLGMAVVGWFARELWAAVKELKSDISQVREQLMKEYLTKDDYRDLKTNTALLKGWAVTG
jgi:hypothetical protein